MKNKGKSDTFKHIDFLIIDLLVLEGAYFIAYLIRLSANLTYISMFYTQIFLMIAVGDLLYVGFKASYKNILRRSMLREIYEVIKHVLFVCAINFIFLFFTKRATDMAIGVFFWSIGISLVLVLIIRNVYKVILRNILTKGDFLPKLVVLANKKQAQEWVLNLRYKRFIGFDLIGFVLSDELDYNVRTIRRYPVICHQDEILEYARSHVVDEIIVLTEYNSITMQQCSTLLKMGIKVHIGVDSIMSKIPNPHMEVINDFEVLTSDIHVITLQMRLIKRIMDIFAGIVGCIITFIAYIFLAPFIYFKSPGPIFFSQVRIGRNGRKFNIYKFRSMYLDAEERKAALMKNNKMTGLMFKMDNDPRIIGNEKGNGKGIGSFIRATSIDELPQFFNVLKGDMSLIGTRPPTLDEYEQYELHHKVRLSITPGITGMWQVSGRSDILDFE